MVSAASFRDLGVFLIDDFLRFDRHVDNVVCKAGLETTVWENETISERPNRAKAA